VRLCSDAPTTVVEDPVATGEDVESALAKLEQETMHESWYNVLEGEFGKPYFKKVSITAMYSCELVNSFHSIVERVPTRRT
jgi:hypothetical protein